MLPEFLAYRYEGLKRPDQILLQKENIGWKCRKYIRWRQVHTLPDDGKVLWTFANDLFEKGEVDLNLYGQVNLILLNVQRWRLDKDNLSVDPPANEAWEYVSTLLQIVSLSPQTIVQWLSEKSIEMPESPVQTQVVFYLHLLDEFFSRQQIPFYLSLSESGITLLNITKFDKVIREHFSNIYESVGLSFPRNLRVHELIQQIYKDLGFNAVSIQKGLKIDSLPAKPVKSQVFVEYKPLEGVKLFKVRSIHGNVFLQLNDNHAFVREVLQDDKAKKLFEGFFKCYAISIIEMTSLSESILTFSAYLETRLEQEFSSTKK